MKYLFIDTNILVRIISQGKPGCEVVHLDQLASCVRSSAIVLLLPEIVELELAKNWMNFNDRIDEAVGSLEKELQPALNKSLWSEIVDIQKSLSIFLAEQKAIKIREARSRYEEVVKLLTMAQVVKLPFTPEIYFKGKKRIMAGRMPRQSNASHSDACILETLADHLSTFMPEGLTNSELYFCSENVTDFGCVESKMHMLHQMHRTDFPITTKYCISLDHVFSYADTPAKNRIVAVEIIDSMPLSDGVILSVTEKIIRPDVKDDCYCSHPGCMALRNVFSKYCAVHYEIIVSSMTPEDKISQAGIVEGVLLTLPYREREIIKLRTGIGGGYIYTYAECAKIFKTTPAKIKLLEQRGYQRLQHPVRKRMLDSSLA